MPGRRSRVALAVLLVVGLALSACAAEPRADAAPSASATPSTPSASATPSVPGPTPHPVVTPFLTPTAAAPPTPTPSADGIVDAMTREERVGQLFMVGTPVDRASRRTLAAVRDRHVGAVFLAGRSTKGPEKVAAVVDRFTSLAGSGSGSGTTAEVPLWIATDQEGGAVQVLRGEGFSDIPYAIRQADAADGVLERRATRWGAQLRRAGVTMNLAPVADIVTSAATRFDNAPIGAFGRQYGYDERTVGKKASAFARGMRAAGILPTLKHFPGLGRVTDNTDTTAHVVDTVVRASSPDVDVYRRLLADGPAAVMVSSAIYQRIDPSSPAMFSPVVVDRLLRGRVGFDGVVITDDVSAARAVASIPPGQRAIRAIEAGVDVVLVSADPSVLPEMYDAVLARANDDPAFAARVDESARRVVLAKTAPDAPGR